ncbi:delta-60 repeat domain-containing protein, partial [Streptomyces sp. NPDC055085]
MSVTSRSHPHRSMPRRAHGGAKRRWSWPYRLLAALTGMILAAASILILAPTAHAAPGDLDPTFGTNGKTIADLGGDDGTQAMVLQPDGKIITAGVANNSADTAVARFTTTGALDPTFSGDGKSVIDLGGFDQANAVVLQPDGKIITAGSRGTDTVVARFTTTGALDPTFDTDGKSVIDVGGFDQANA